jgi:hypothetical protein
LRLHGHNAETWEKPNITAAERFRYLYSEDELRGWVGPVWSLAEQAERVHVLMNNCYRDYAVRNARQFAALLQTNNRTSNEHRDLPAIVAAGRTAAEWPSALQALWHEAKGDWHRAHQLAQEQDNADGAWVHAHLYRAEGDAANAGYWYRWAGRSPSAAPLDQERDAIAAALLSRDPRVSA